MLRMGKETKQEPQKILNQATAYFGPGGVGLNVIPRGPHALEFTGKGNDFVLVQVEPKENGADIDIQTREWDYDVKRFLRKI